MKSNSRKAFTLIELLVVIAIIAILAAILFPVFAQAREKARQITCVSNMKQLTLAIIMYVQDYDENFPAAYDGGGLAGGVDGIWSGGSMSHWQQKITPYIRSTGVFACPDDPGAGAAQPGNSWKGIETSYATNGWFDWGWQNDGAKPLLFGVMTGGTWGGGPSAIMPGIAQTDARINHPDATIMLCELYSSDLAAVYAATGDSVGQGGNFTNFGFDNTVGVPGWMDLGATIPYYPAPDQSSTAYDYPESGTPNYAPWNNATGGPGAISIHHVSNTLSNYAFVDGHVKSMTAEQTNPDCTWHDPGPDKDDLWNAIRE